MKKATLVGLFLVVAACTGGGGGASSGIPALMSPSGATGDAAAKNNEGVDHLSQGHYDVAGPLFEQALSADPNFAEAHFNLGVTKDGQGDHGGATESFKKALELGKDNPKIAGNDLLKKHLGM